MNCAVDNVDDSEIEENSASEAGESDILLINMEARADHVKVQKYNIIYGIATFVGIFLIALVLFWTFYFREGLNWSVSKIFNWHPLLMTVGMIFFFGQSMLIYRTGRFYRKRDLKLVHAIFYILAFSLSVIGLKAVFDSHNFQRIPNMYSLHSWIGLTTTILFCLQFVVGFVSYLFPGLPMDIRAALMPVHTNVGFSIFIMASISGVTGLLEKAIFVLPETYKEFPPEGIFINIMGFVLIIFSLLVVYLVVEIDYKRQNIPEDGFNLVAATPQ